jgi:hypothetical protein
LSISEVFFADDAGVTALAACEARVVLQGSRLYSRAAAGGST